MRIFLVVGLIVICAGTSRSHIRAEEPKTIIQNAIQAMGGEQRVAKLQAFRMKAKGTVNLGPEIPFTSDMLWQWPNQYKLTAELQAGGKKVALVQGFDGANGWGGAGNAIIQAEGSKLIELRAQMNLRRILMLIPLLTEKSFELGTLDDVQFDGKTLVRVKVSAPGERDVILSFDKGTGLLAKIDRTVLDQSTSKEVSQEDVLSNYQVVDGVKIAMKEMWHRSGNKVAEMNYTEVAFPAKIDPQEFRQPASNSVGATQAIRTTNIIYGHKFGMALTMDVFTPTLSYNGAAIVFVVSGGWISDNAALNPQLIQTFISEPTKRGYTVFAVLHGSQPKFTIPEAVSDLHRAVRYIRHYARHYQVDPQRIGIMGGSAGGHLSLMQATAGDLGNSAANDVVERESSRVQSVACLFPPTDFLNYGEKDKYAFALDGTLAAFRAAMDVRQMDAKTHRYERPADEATLRQIAGRVSPISHASADDPPTRIIHGDADKLVPIQQAELLIEKLKSAGVRAELVVRQGRGHDFNGIDKDVLAMVDWFDETLIEKP